MGDYLSELTAALGTLPAASAPVAKPVAAHAATSISTFSEKEFERVQDALLRHRGEDAPPRKIWQILCRVLNRTPVVPSNTALGALRDATANCTALFGSNRYVLCVVEVFFKHSEPVASPAAALGALDENAPDYITQVWYQLSQVVSGVPKSMVRSLLSDKEHPRGSEAWWDAVVDRARAGAHARSTEMQSASHDYALIAKSQKEGGLPGLNQLWYELEAFRDRYPHFTPGEYVPPLECTISQPTYDDVRRSTYGGRPTFTAMPCTGRLLSQAVPRATWEAMPVVFQQTMQHLRM